MKILALSDRVDPIVYSSAARERFGGVDLIVGCGDLPDSYLEFIVSMLDVPLVYVPGNHDLDRYRVAGGANVDGRLRRVDGLSILGFGGSRRYKRQGRHQYSEWEMYLRIAVHAPRLAVRRILKGRACDLLVTHAPPFGIQDRTDPAHTGFKAFVTFLRLFRPAVMLHGHVHVARNLGRRQTNVDGSTVVNAYPFAIIEFEEGRVRLQSVTSGMHPEEPA